MTGQKHLSIYVVSVLVLFECQSNRIRLHLRLVIGLKEKTQLISDKAKVHIGTQTQENLVPSP
jgi:hypothetical protein